MANREKRTEFDGDGDAAPAPKLPGQSTLAVDRVRGWLAGTMSF